MKIREKIIRAYEFGAGTIEEIGIIFEIKSRRVAKYLQPKAEFNDALLESITSINDNDFEEWYESCGYSMAA